MDKENLLNNVLLISTLRKVANSTAIALCTPIKCNSAELDRNVLIALANLCNNAENTEKICKV